jgi:hypothetical protein
MAGVNSGPNATGHVFDSGGTVVGDTSTGTMFVFTDAAYPGLSSQVSALPNAASMPTLYQGDLNFKNADITVNGVVNSITGGSALPSSMNPYTGVAWWQDRRNSTVEFNQCVSLLVCTNPTSAPHCPNCTGDDGTVVDCAACGSGNQVNVGMIVTDNHVTPTSPNVTLDPGNVALHMTGAYYQPRGASVTIVHGTGSISGSMQVISGSIFETTGDTRLLLTAPTNPILTYRTALIQ